MAKLTRDDRVLAFLKSHETINFFEALYQCGTTRLAAAIWNLRHKRNLTIDKEMIPHTNQFGNTENVAYYKLIN
jgi:hypothetical protein